MIKNNMHIFYMTEYLRILQYTLNSNTKSTNIFVGTVAGLFKTMYNPNHRVPFLCNLL